MNLEGINLVTLKRANRIQTYLKTEDKARCLVAGLLLRRFCNVTDDNQLMFGENGKPYLTDHNFHFNISHSGDYVVLATSDSEIGVDIEKITIYEEAVAVRCFTNAEQEWLKKQGNNEAFFILWTAKESIMKGFGFGLSLPPESFCVLPIDDTPHQINGRVWFFNWFKHDGHVICLTISHIIKEKKMKIVLPNDLLN